jgi:hypothetical protein
MEDNYTIEQENDSIYIRKITPKKSPSRAPLSNDDLLRGIIVNFPYSNEVTTCFTKTKNIPLSKKFNRIIIIPYIIDSDKKYFCMGIDSKYGNLIDFGGPILPGENFIKTIQRNLKCESLNMFDLSEEYVCNNSYSLYDNVQILCLIKVEANMSNICKTFFDKNSLKMMITKSSLLWVPEQIFYSLLKRNESIIDNNCIYPSLCKINLKFLQNLNLIQEKLQT